ncbi:MAG: hypothetical protein UT61_C0034G0004 [Candidatus Woesebacteria bacterium GW2011_GWA1_39_8]|uniref:ATP synthase protein I n=1 Tax=Candidatus Woesebacteria bacterium GW2011_GWA1_39_8 TaxID=1618552 RepID=A0A0G0PVV6_9BACT|nr:MAG: hypothetical protein UT61_C0034G0004 [Candidatus Woesebacteria bacterium GW2011_GWA1_39_8]
MASKEEKEFEAEVKRQSRIREKVVDEAKEFKKQFAERTLKLVTSGFGLVAALAWNELIKKLISDYIQPLFGEDSGLISLLIYAVIVTALAVFITYQLGKMADDKEED